MENKTAESPNGKPDPNAADGAPYPIARRAQTAAAGAAVWAAAHAGGLSPRAPAAAAAPAGWPETDALAGAAHIILTWAPAEAAAVLGGFAVGAVIAAEPLRRERARMRIRAGGIAGFAGLAAAFIGGGTVLAAVGLATLAASALNEPWRAARPVLWFGAIAAVLGPLALLYRDYRGILETASVWNQDPAVLLAWGSESWNPDPPWAAASQENALIGSWRSWAGMRAAVVTKSGALELAAGTVPAAAAGVAARRSAPATRRTAAVRGRWCSRPRGPPPGPPWRAVGRVRRPARIERGVDRTRLAARGTAVARRRRSHRVRGSIGAAAGVPTVFRRAGGLKAWIGALRTWTAARAVETTPRGTGAPGNRDDGLETWNDPADADPALLQRALAAYLLGIGALFLVPDAATTPNWPGDPLYGHGVATVTAMIAAGVWRRSAWPGRCRVETRRTRDHCCPTIEANETGPDPAAHRRRRTGAGRRRCGAHRGGPAVDPAVGASS